MVARSGKRSVNIPPTIDCNADTSYVADYFKDYVVIKLGRPGWSDDKWGVKITQVGGPTSGSKFYEGRHALTYKATDTEGATDYCVKYVTIKVIKCKRLGTPYHGSKRCDNDDNIYGTDCHFTCDTGYKLKGYAKSSCQRSGYFDHTMPSCNIVHCNILSTPSHGSKYCDKKQNVYRTTCTFSCDKGFELSGYKTSTCQSSGSYSHSTPSCKRVLCPYLSTPAHGTGFSCTNGRYYGSVCSLECEAGYSPELGLYTVCQDTKRWSSTDFLCKPNRCSSLMTPPFGTKTCNKKHNEYGTECKFSCNAGFLLDGYEKSKCLHNGSYTHPTPKCHRIACSALELPEHGTEFKCTNSWLFGSVCSLECETGYTTVGESHIMCDVSRTWTKSDFSCRGIQCNILSTPSHGSKRCNSHQNIYGTECTFVCEKGFELSGHNTSRCLSNGSYSDPTPTCNRISCPELEIPEYATHFKCTDGWKFGSICSLNCERGYATAHGLYGICQYNKRWSTEDFVCKAIQCSNLVTPPHGTKYCDKQQNVYGTECMFGCDKGFKLDGYHKSVCQSNGSYNHPTPKCNRISCPNLELPDHGINFRCTNDWYFGSVCSLECKPGYTAIDGSHIMCHFSKMWTKSDFICEDTEKPRFTNCPNTTITSDNMSISWPPLKVQDNSGSASIHQTIGKPSGSSFSVGYHVIKYDAQDLAGNKAYPCVFTVKVEALFCSNPKDTFKEDPQLMFIDCKSSQTKFVEGKICQLGCQKGSVGGAKYVKCERDESLVASAKWVTKNAGKPFCISEMPKSIGIHFSPPNYRGKKVNYRMNIKRLEKGCPPLRKPKNGELVCNDQTTTCKLKCNVWFDTSEKSVDTYICNERQKTWFPTHVIQDCSAAENRSEYRLSSEFYYIGNQFDEEAETMIKNSFNKALEMAMNACSDVECKAENIIIKYVKESNGQIIRHKRSPTDTDATDGKQHIPRPYITATPESSSGDDFIPISESSGDELPFTPEVSGKDLTAAPVSSSNDFSPAPKLFRNYFTSSSKTTYSPGLPGNDLTTVPKSSENVSTPSPRLPGNDEGRNMIRHRLLTLHFDLVVSASKASADEASAILSSVVQRTSRPLYSPLEEFPLHDFKILDITVQCQTGFTHAKKYHGRCVACGVGTFHKKNQDLCMPCPKGTYQPAEGQTSCLACPPGTSTLGNGTKIIARCMDTCKPHEYSSTGLQPCFRCPGGTIQPREGSTFCHLCPLGTMNHKVTKEPMCIPREYCNQIQGGCDHICETMEGGSTCTCKNDYILQADGFTCAKLPYKG
ncbi:sushi, von Willebrand factor type A, EGF and pentraxin domain-containing protein 1-like [Gigantopelta aegis]|uniref:sushi, von Willebrand factor type A, EGF and pentraxin domain-containing protein 1-like n=1 Tax=Gigantopelta aegis TaxID=1735272 RepID=UPI001B8899FD|nr:sushi, von Willebrand factor type A, EGF and pentraxin domain-containing protein 1-like [Gigantopelta aegis]